MEITILVFYSTGYLSSDPVELIRSMLPAATSDYTPRISVLSFGRGVYMSDVERMITQSIRNGAWLVLHNCHLAPKWSPEVLQLIRVSLTYPIPKRISITTKNFAIFGSCWLLISS